MMYCVLNDCECYPWGCIDVISITMNDFEDCPQAIEMGEEADDIYKELYL